jgi:hypothetical protein
VAVAGTLQHGGWPVNGSPVRLSVRVYCPSLAGIEFGSPTPLPGVLRTPMVIVSDFLSVFWRVCVFEIYQSKGRKLQHAVRFGVSSRLQLGGEGRVFPWVTAQTFSQRRICDDH